MPRLLILLVLLLLAPVAASRADPLDDARAGLGALTNGNYEKAIDLYTKAIDSGALSDTKAAAAYLGRGEAYVKTDQFDAAIDDLTTSLGLDHSASNLEECYRWRARAYEKSDQRGEAIDDYRKLGRVHPGDREARDGLIRLGENPSFVP